MCLPAVARPGVGHDDPYPFLRHAESLRQFASYTEGSLRSCPDGELVAFPAGDGGARFQGSVGDVGNRIGRFQRAVGGRHPLFHGASCSRRRAAPAAALLLAGGAPEVIVKLPTTDLGGREPLCPDGRNRGEGFLVRGRRNPDEVAILDDGDTGEFGGCRRVDRNHGRIERRWAQHLAKEHVGNFDVGGILVRPGDERMTIHFGHRRACHLPFLRTGEWIVLGDRSHELSPFGELADADGAPCRAIDDAPVLDRQAGPINAPLSGRQIQQELARRHRDSPQLQRHNRRRVAPEGPGIIGGQVGIAHDHRDRRKRNLQLLGDNLSQRRADILTHLDLAGENGYSTVGADVQPRADVARCLPAAPPSAATGFLQSGGVFEDQGDRQTSAEYAEEVTAIESEAIGGTLVLLIAFGGIMRLIFDGRVFAVCLRTGSRHPHRPASGFSLLVTVTPRLVARAAFA